MCIGGGGWWRDELIKLLLNLPQIAYPVVKREALVDVLKKHLFGNLVKVGW